MERSNFKQASLGCLLSMLMLLPGCSIKEIERRVVWEKCERTVQLSEPMVAGSIFRANSSDGWIIVIGGNIADCNVTGTIIAQAQSYEDARRIIEQTTLKLEKFGNAITVKIEKPLLISNQNVDFQLKAMVPKNSDVELGTDGDITIEDITGEIDLETNEGRVTLSRVGGVVKVRSNDGPIEAKKITGDVNLQSDDGSITVVYSEDAGGVCSISLVTNEGPIDLTTPTDFSADVEISTDDGLIVTDWPIEVRGKLGKRGIKGTIGTGEGKLYIRTNDGSIRIK